MSGATDRPAARKITSTRVDEETSTRRSAVRTLVRFRATTPEVGDSERRGAAAGPDFGRVVPPPALQSPCVT